jgi:hypothetical protein
MGTLKVLAISIVILFTLLACALIPQGVQNLFATKTPTATATPTPVPPYTHRYAVTANLLKSLRFSGILPRCGKY